jgi:hypothetical protein
MSSIREKDQKSLIVMEMANRELRRDLTLALILISNKKHSFSNLDKYDVKKRLLLELFEYDKTKIDNEEMVRIF